MTTISTPCIKVCVIDPGTRLCRGCLRSLDEIAAWSGMSEPDRQLVMTRLPDRRSLLAGATP